MKTLFSKTTLPPGRRLFMAGILAGGLVSLFSLFKGLASFLGAVLPQTDSGRMALDAWEILQQKGNGPVYRKGLWLVRDELGWYGLINTCTHLGCRPVLEASGKELVCPCHRSRFNLQGEVLRGPAVRPLKRPFLWKGADGRLWADLHHFVGTLFRIKP
jgi:nitrite reductase/ring-hydroxylating ferredoxin subunit